MEKILETLKARFYDIVEIKDENGMAAECILYDEAGRMYQRSFSLIGTKEETEPIVEQMKELFEREIKTKDKRLFYVKESVRSLDTEEFVTSDERYWGFWKRVVGQCSGMITQSVLEELGIPEEERNKILEKYSYFRETSCEELAEDVFTSAELTELWEFYEEYNIHIYLIITEFEEVLRLYPDVKNDSLFVENLFSLSIKGGSYRPLSILLVSEEEMGKFDLHTGKNTSYMIDAYYSYYA